MNNLVSFNFSPGVYREQDYRTSLMGTSDCNMFIPFFSLFAHQMLAFEDSDVRVLEYALPRAPQRGQVQRQYLRMKQHLVRGQSPVKYTFKLRGVDHSINMHRGMLYDGEHVLLCLGVDTNYVMSTPIDTISSNLDPTKFSLFISDIYENDDRLRNIRKKVDEMYVAPLKRAGVDVVFTSRINTWLFSNNYEAPKFKNVTQLMKHLQEEVPRILLIQ